ncbi:hypothetical protein M1271_01070 [Patescibacteria group bacterium]|nr:hypothetical protein [Patescibacteria group bacterium]MCL5798420.1 hypothetical protein [Patescibacteria group bacterium]
MSPILLKTSNPLSKKNPKKLQKKGVIYSVVDRFVNFRQNNTSSESDMKKNKEGTAESFRPGLGSESERF